MLRLHFHPGALFRLLYLPLSHFTDEWFDAEPVINREVYEINECFANCYSYVQMIEVVEEYLKSILLQFGYSDYQHLVKDFKAFANVSPNVWIHQDNQSPERIFHLE